MIPAETASRHLLRSLTECPRLLADLPNASAFSTDHLAVPESIHALNFEQKLGHLYEDALAVLLEHSPRYDLVAQNLQLQKDIHTTVGELDFLIRDRIVNQLIHLELAIKFYLAVETPVGFDLPGPDARDNFFRKLTRLADHQLELPSCYPDLLPAEFQNPPPVSQHLVLGILFDHLHATELAEPAFVNPHCRRGKWLHLHEFASAFPDGSTFSLIPKHLWPVPVPLLRELDLPEWQAPAQLDRCTMTFRPDDDTPYFIAPDGYPHH